MSYITVVGGGSWGTALAALLAKKDFDVTLWAFEKDLVEIMREQGTNTWYLPNVPLPGNLHFSSDLEECIPKARYVVCVVPTQFIRSVFQKALPFLQKETVIISASKGIEKGSLKTVSEILAGICPNGTAVISGPSFAKEVVQELPTAVTLATQDPEVAYQLQEMFNTDYFRVYTHTDMKGVEIGGALKNVIAIASGISDGMSLGFNARAALITRGIAEITRLGIKVGADPMTFAGLSGIGDLVLTCTGALSRNYTVGIKLGQGMKLSEIISATSSVAEGVETSISAYELAAKHEVEMPIVDQIYHVLHKGKDPSSAVMELMNRSLKSEFYEGQRGQ